MNNVAGKAGQGLRDLLVWQKAVDLVTEIYRETRSFPKDEIYGITNQLRRAAVWSPAMLLKDMAGALEKSFANSYAKLEVRCSKSKLNSK